MQLSAPLPGKRRVSASAPEEEMTLFMDAASDLM
jgi:hypothetical protein